MAKRKRGEKPMTDMLDQLQVMNLDTEGASILKSMADSIRSALQQGLLLEQIILEQRSQTLEQLHLKKSKKSAKRRRHEADMPGVSGNQEFDNTAPQPSKMVQARLPPSIKNNDNLFHQNQNIISNECTMKPPELPQQPEVDGSKEHFSGTGIRLIDQSKLLNSNSSTPIKLNPNIFTEPSNNLSQQMLSQNEIHALNTGLNQSVFPSPFVSSSNQSIARESLCQNYDFNNATLPDVKEEASPESNSPTKSGIHNSPGPSTLLERVNNTPVNTPQPNRPLTQDDYEHPVMPTPIVIKSEVLTHEYKEDEPEPLIPLDIELSINTPSGSSEAPSRNVKDNESLDQLDLESNQNDFTEHEKFKDFQAFLLAGKDATREEVEEIFIKAGLEPLYVHIVNKNMHSYGFVNFVNKMELKKALNLSRKHEVGGTYLSIRQSFDKKKRSTDSSDHGGQTSQQNSTGENTSQNRRGFPSNNSPRENTGQNRRGFPTNNSPRENTSQNRRGFPSNNSPRGNTSQNRRGFSSNNSPRENTSQNRRGFPSNQRGGGRQKNQRGFPHNPASVSHTDRWKENRNCNRDQHKQWRGGSQSNFHRNQHRNRPYDKRNSEGR